MLWSISEISDSEHFSSFSFRTHDKVMLKFVLSALRPPRSPTREHINGVPFLLTCDDDVFRFNAASTHKGHLRQNGVLGFVMERP